MPSERHMHHGPLHFRGQHREWIHEIVAWRSDLVQVATILAKASDLL